MADETSSYDTTRLRDLGKRRQRLEDQLRALDAELDPEIFAAARAEVAQVDIMEWTGHSKETVRRKSMTPERLAAERAKRRQKSQ